jgi:hypothetical protein
MAVIINDTEIEFTCDNCGVRTKKSLEWIKEHDQLTCDCGTMIPVDPGQYRKELAKTESELDGFQGLMGKLGQNTDS